MHLSSSIYPNMSFAEQLEKEKEKEPTLTSKATGYINSSSNCSSGIGIGGILLMDGIGRENKKNEESCLRESKLVHRFSGHTSRIFSLGMVRHDMPV